MNRIFFQTRQIVHPKSEELELDYGSISNRYSRTVKVWCSISANTFGPWELLMQDA